MRRILVAITVLSAAIVPAHSSGTINLSLSQQLDNLGNPLSGCKLYFYQAGTTTPQTAYADVGLSLALPNPLECDSAGRLPQFFLADGQIKIRLSDAGGGNTYIAADNLLVIGPSGGGGGGGSVDPATVLATGDLKQKYGTGNLPGFVRANGRTVGSATSGAAERANADCQALFEYLWSADVALAVSGGRGVSANADWLANKTIVTPDFRGRFIAGLDDMGTTAAGRLPTLITLGLAGGLSSYTISVPNLPSHVHPFNTNVDGAHAVSGSTSAGGNHDHGGLTTIVGVPHTHNVSNTGAVQSGLGGTGVGPGSQATGSSTDTSHNHGIPVDGSHTHTFSGTGVAHQHSGTTGGAGSGTPISIFPPTLPITIYLKL